ncbi:MAG: ComF family protein [Sphingobacteriaceae bacterium]
MVSVKKTSVSDDMLVAKRTTPLYALTDMDYGMKFLGIIMGGMAAFGGEDEDEDDDYSMEEGDIIVRALGHQETAILRRSDPKPMDVLCRHVADKVGCDYVSDLLRKKRKNVKLRGLSRLECERTLENGYELAPVFGRGDKRVWIVDDVVTTGSTIRAIAAALGKLYTSVGLSAFCRARTDGYSGLFERGVLQGEHYGWDMQGGWVALEEVARYDDLWLPEAGNLSCPEFGNEGT